MNDQRFATHILCMNAGRVGEPVVCVNDVVLLLACNDTSHNRVVVDFVLQVIGIASRKLNAAQVIGQAVIKVGINIVAQLIVKLRRHTVTQTLLVVVHVAPYDRRFAHADDVHKALVLVAPGFRQTKSDMNVRLQRQPFSDAVAGCTQPTKNMRGKFPAKHKNFHNVSFCGR